MRLSFIFLIFLLQLSCSNKAVDFSEGFTDVVDLESDALFDHLQQNKGVVIDVRTKEEIDRGYIIGASFIDYYDPQFLTKASWIKKDQPIYVYCHAGGRSAKAAKKLLGLGFKNVYNLSGGYRDWSSSGYPVKQGFDANFKKSEVYTNEELNIKLLESQFTLLVFKTPWCLPCKKLSPVLEKFSKQMDNWNVIILNMDTNQKLADEFGVLSVPTILGFSHSDQLFSHIGYINFLDLVGLTSH